MSAIRELAGLSIDEFMQRFWQKEHYFARSALKVDGLITADELAGLSLEEEVESRLIIDKEGILQVNQGPFQEDTFESLPDSNWTLLVQAVDQWVPAVQSLFNRFDFIPQWRKDDVMISFAAPGGSVGPHYDQYDVFLIQLEGNRTWKIGEKCDHYTPRLENDQLDLVKLDAHEAEYQTRPGDVLYVPPGVAHWGVADSASLTLSVGFRAPSDGEMLQDFGKHVEDLLGPDYRFSDAQRKASSGEDAQISGQDLDIVRTRLKMLLDDDQLLATWFGSLMTEPKYDELLPLADRLELHREEGNVLLRDAVTRTAYSIVGGTVQWFCNGHVEELDASYLPLVKALSNQSFIELSALSQLTVEDKHAAWLQSLIEEGHFYVGYSPSN